MVSFLFQSVFNCLPEREKKGGTLLVSGDGRYFTIEAIHEICCIAAGNGVGRVWIGRADRALLGCLAFSMGLGSPCAPVDGSAFLQLTPLHCVREQGGSSKKCLHCT